VVRYTARQSSEFCGDKGANESSDGETLIAVGIWFQICGAAEEKHDVQTPKSVFILGTYKRDWLEKRSKRLYWW